MIVNTASIAAYEGQIGTDGLRGLKRRGGIVDAADWRGDLSPRCSARHGDSAPGLFLTPMLKGLPEEVQDSLGKTVPHPARLGDPAEFAGLVQHIVENPMLNGEVIRLDGALRMAPR